MYVSRKSAILILRMALVTCPCHKRRELILDALADLGWCHGA